MENPLRGNLCAITDLFFSGVDEEGGERGGGEEGTVTYVTTFRTVRWQML